MAAIAAAQTAAPARLNITQLHATPAASAAILARALRRSPACALGRRPHPMKMVKSASARPKPQGCLPWRRRREQTHARKSGEGAHMSRADAIARAQDYFDSGTFKNDLARRVAIATESQNPERVGELARYVETEMKPALEALGFRCRVMRQAKARGPFLYAERSEGEGLPTVLGYGHGDVIRGLEAGWHAGLSPWQLVERDGCYWGRGVVDNKGQHTINLAALAAVLAVRGRLGFNAKWLIEMGEETGSAGLRELCAENRDLFAADVLIASDGPRMAADRATLSLGCRGAYPIDLTITAREGGHHSGNWGGLLSNPALQLAHALATIAGPTGQVRIPEWVPKEIPDSVRRVLAECEIVSGPGDPQIDPAWGEPGLTAAEKVYAWCTFEVLAMS